MTLKLEDINSVFFIGIGGIGMSALARYFNTRSVKVSGYDKTETVLTKKLVEEGIEVHYIDDVALIPSHIDLVVYTPAVPKDHSQLVHLLNRGIPMLKRAELLGVISRSSKTIAVGGTHGKTTTSAMVTHTLLHCKENVAAFLGGIMTGYETNYFIGNSDYVVVEADEFDRSFLHLSPYIAVVNSVDADHLDIYGTTEKVMESYLAFINKTIEGGYLLLTENVAQDLGQEVIRELKLKFKVIIIGFNEDCDVFLSILKVESGRVIFDLVSQYGSIHHIALRMPGYHNVSNAAVAITIALLLQKDKNEIVSAIENFKGIKRRFEWIVDGEKVYIDDYAHHPTELKMAISAARMVYPGKKILGIFQPHLFTRTRDFADGFAKELGFLDEVILMEIYPARESPIDGVNSTMLLNKIENKNKFLLDENEILNKVKAKDYDVLMTLGAGNIDLLIPKIKDILKAEN
jgi:UDP-N-acetylmuramate--alanine ligase